ncbi:UbiD family decarboxylase [Bacillus sp. Marseille-P3661]|uniref:UbiD family decarboxylase n=1 Tax=Bacillus sp. Marseille-P3661 TaxID=1936234 RepID=UPI0015E1AB09|nr:UbiD family decarboxylase [Bacillus sp. Marseille-P3661]
MVKSLQSYLEELKRNESPELVEINKKTIPHKFEVTALLEKMDQKGDTRIPWFKNVVNNHDESTDMSVVSNLFGTRERIGQQIGGEAIKGGMAVSLEYAKRELEKIKPIIISANEAPVKEEIQKGVDIDIEKLPIVRHYEMDLSPVLTMMLVMKDPDEGFYDVSFTKVFPKGPDTAGVSIHSPHLERILTKYEERGLAAPIVSIIGHHPAFTLGAAARVPFGNDDYATIGAFLQESVRLVPSETWGEDFLVPADAEILIEAEIQPGARTIVDPFGEVTRDYQPQCLRQLANIKAITKRKNAVLQDIFSGHPEHWLLGGIAKEGGLYNMLQKQFGNITGVKMPYSGCCRIECHIAIKKRTEGEAYNVGMAAFGFDSQLQWITVVDDDIDPFNEFDVRFAAVNYVNPDKDIQKIRARNHFYNAGAGWKVIVDATKQTEVPSPTRFRVPPDVMDRIELDDYLNEKDSTILSK